MVPSNTAISAIPTGSLAPESPSRMVPARPWISRSPRTENTTAGSVGDSAAPISIAVELVATGHRESFTSLYDATAARVFGVARAVLRNDHLAEEVCQDVFLEIWQRAARFDRSRGPGWPG